MRRPILMLAAVVSLALMGQACTPWGKSPAVSNLPNTAPESAFMEDKAVDKEMEKDDGVTEDTKKDDAMMEGKESTKDEGMIKDEAKMEDDQSSAVPYYIAYSKIEFNRAVSANKATLLYFYAPWCPICRAEDPKIKAWIEGSGLDVAGFRVDYDNETQLKQQLGVTYQHTTIIFDTQGKESARFSGAMEQATLLEALRKASQI